MFKLASQIQHYIPSLVVAFILLLSLGWNGCLGANFCKYEEHYSSIIAFISCAFVLFQGKVRIERKLLAFAVGMLVWCTIGNIVNKSNVWRDVSFALAMVAFFIVSSKVGAKAWTNIIAGLTCALSVFAFLQLRGMYLPMVLFDNNAGWAAAMCLGSICMTVSFLGTKKPKWLLVVGLLFLIVVAYNLFVMSRSGFLAFIVGQGYLLFKNRLPGLLQLSLLFIVFAIVAYALYNRNKDSADGRILIYQTCLSLCREAPIVGHGSEAIASCYMVAQANVLAKRKDDRQAWLASDVNYAFNEPLSFTVCYGAVGLLLVACFFCLLLKSVKESQRRDLFAMMLSFGVMAMFSYPTAYRYICFLLVGEFSCCLPHRDNQCFSLNLRVTILFVATLLLLSFCEVIALFNGYKWEKAYRCYEEGNIVVASRQYAALLSHLQANGYFCYNYAVLLNEAGDYIKSDSVLHLSERHLRNYDTELLAGDNALSLKNFVEARERFTVAHKMVPVRFMPLYGLLQTALQQGNVHSAKNYARTICCKPVKVHSLEIQDVKLDAKRILLKIEERP